MLVRTLGGTYRGVEIEQVTIRARVSGYPSGQVLGQFVKVRTSHNVHRFSDVADAKKWIDDQIEAGNGH